MFRRVAQLKNIKQKMRLFIYCLLLGLVLPAAAAADELNEAVREAQEIYRQQTQTEGQLKNLTIKATEMENKLKDLSVKITQASNDLTAKETAYLSAVREVDDIKAAVTRKQEEVETRQEALRDRSRKAYEEGNVSYLAVVFQSASISDFLTRLEYMERMIGNDQSILDDVRTQKTELETQKTALELKMAEAEKLKKEAAAAKNYLATSQAQQQAALQENERDRDELLEQMEQLEKDSKELEAKIRELQRQNTSGITGAITTWPTPGYAYITSPFEIRRHPITGVVKLHTGVDIGAANRSKILAAGSGTVILASWYGAYGNAVIIDHGNGVSSLYGHMSSIAAQVGNPIVAGQVIGYVGSTGYSTGPHLHFEIRLDGTPTDPMVYFK
jgi:murein DD-endopeptidase MepM/ murein hydrolase activator NlpD